MHFLIFTIFLVVPLTNHVHADYVGAVVEYNVLAGQAPNLTIEENLKNYVYQIEQAKGFEVQLIVFPEYGLTGLVEEPQEYAVPVPSVGTSNFTNEAYVLLALSNAAYANQLYVVVNLLERETDSSNNTLYYNTNAVFADNGTLVAKYRKINLFAEPRLTAGNELSIFSTSFGTFALITCMDILYYHPAQSVLANSGVTDVIYPAAWNSYIPFYMSLEVQVGYALANRVNVLTANINDPPNGMGGSSIVSYDGTVLRRILIDRPVTNFAYSELKSPEAVLFSKEFEVAGLDVLNNATSIGTLPRYNTKTDFEYDRYINKRLDLSPENVTDEICDRDFCCNFNIVAYQNETDSSEIYRLFAFSGRTRFDVNEVGVKFCALVACQTDSLSTCASRPLSVYNTVFRRITVWGNWETVPEEFYRPIGLGGDLEPIYNSTYLQSTTNETVGVSFNVTRSRSNVVLFGLYVRSGAENVNSGIVFGLAVSILVFVRGIF